MQDKFTLPKSRQQEARDIAVNVRLYPNGISSGELADTYGQTFVENHPGTTRKELVDFIQKALANLTIKGYVRYQERDGKTPRQYFPCDKLLAQYPKQQPPPAAEQTPASKTTETTESAASDIQTDEADCLLNPIILSGQTEAEKAFDTARFAIGELARLARENQQQTHKPIDDFPELIDDLNLVESFLNKIRPDLAASVSKAIEILT